MSDTIPENTPEKQCTQCKEALPATTDYFHRNSHAKDGLKRVCKRCRSKPRSPGPTSMRTREGEKQCKACKEWLPATKAYFHADNSKKYKDRLKPECKKCRGRVRNFGFVPKECKDGEKECLGCHEVLPASDEYFYRSPKDPSKFISRCKKCRGRGTTFGKQSWVREHRADTKWCSRCKKWLPKNTDYFSISRGRKDGYYPYCKQCGVKDRVTRHDVIERQQKAYYHAHKDKRFALARNHKARKKSVPGTHTAAEIQEQLKRQKYRCYYAACGHEKFKKSNGKYIYHVDHTFPLSRDGARNSIDHLVLACPACNLAKSDKYPWEWLEGGRLL